MRIIKEIKGDEKMARPKIDFTNIKCCMCGEGNLTSKTAIRGNYISEDLRQKWSCISCYKHIQHSKSDSWHKITRSVAGSRTGNLDPNCTTYKGNMFEALTSIWKEVKYLSKENDRYCGPLDHSTDSEGKIYQTKGSLLTTYPIMKWPFCTRSEKFKNFDSLIAYCATENGSIIERIYIFPIGEVVNRTSINIFKNPLKRSNWYEQYRVDEDIVMKVNKVWENINKKLGN